MQRHNVALYLSPNPGECRVLLDGTEITTACRGVEVQAFVGGDAITRVVLHLLADVEIFGDAGVVEIRKPGAAS